MSDPTTQPTPDAMSASRSGTGAPDQQPDSSASPGTGAAAPRRDYVARLKAEPDFAVEQVQHFQSAASKAEAQLRSVQEKLGPLTNLIDQGVTGNVLAQAISEYQALAQDPQISKAIQAFRETGEVRLSPQPRSNGSEQNVEDEDVYLTDTERAMKQQIEAQNQQLVELRQMVSQTSQNFGVQSLSQHLEKVFTDYNLQGERADKVRDSITQQVQQWQNAGEAGRKAIADLQRPEGRSTVELLVTKALGRDGLLEIAKEQLLREGKVRAGMETDGPSQYGTTGDEPGIQEHDSVLSAIKAARARPESIQGY